MVDFEVIRNTWSHFSFGGNQLILLLSNFFPVATLLARSFSMLCPKEQVLEELLFLLNHL